MRKIEVELGERSYTVAIGAGLLDQAGERLAPYARSGRIVTVSDENAWAAQGARLAASGLDVVPVIVPAGEGSKSWARLQALTERLLELGIERGDAILAFGGGMVGDLAGFAA
ncbi:MAG: 3-dehydroquinate synthase, partial [Allosphingosinicella sp.]